MSRFEIRAPNDPLPRVEVEGFVPFRAVTRHAHVAEIERNHPLFGAAGDGLRHQDADPLDGAEHRSYRAVTSDWFKPANLRQETGKRLPELARIFVDRMLEHGGECDFVRDVALDSPLRVIMSILGVPEKDEPLMLDLTQKVFGGEDPELSKRGEDEDPVQVFMKGLRQIAAYFHRVTEDRRARPTTDLASLELAGTPTSSATTFVGGPKSLPIRYRLRPGR